MTGIEFRCLLDLFMVSDPWPLEEGTRESYSHSVVREMLDREAEKLGFTCWVEAYHEHMKQERRILGEGEAK